MLLLTLSFSGTKEITIVHLLLSRYDISSFLDRLYIMIFEEDLIVSDPMYVMLLLMFVGLSAVHITTET